MANYFATQMTPEERARQQAGAQPGGIAVRGGGAPAPTLAAGRPRVKTSANGGYFAGPPPAAPAAPSVQMPAPAAPALTPAVATPTQPAPDPVGSTTPAGTTTTTTHEVKSPPNVPAPVLKQAPPPPPPSSGIGSGQMAQDLWSQAQQNMKNPSRYDADTVKQAAGVIEDTIKRMRDVGMRNLSEHEASRGLTGSTIESNDVVNLEGMLGEEERSRLSALQREQANTYGADRNSAFDEGLGASGQAQSQYFGERSNNRADTALAGDLAGQFGPEAVPGYDPTTQGTESPNDPAGPAVVKPGSSMTPDAPGSHPLVEQRPGVTTNTGPGSVGSDLSGPNDTTPAPWNNPNATDGQGNPGYYNGAGVWIPGAPPQSTGYFGGQNTVVQPRKITSPRSYFGM